jgi:hypothetical protein
VFAALMMGTNSPDALDPLSLKRHGLADGQCADRLERVDDLFVLNRFTAPATA